MTTPSRRGAGEATRNWPPTRTDPSPSPSRSATGGSRRRGAVLMVQGTSSAAGKSLLVAGLCRCYRRRGVSVAPFKAQNLALNSFVTPDGRELGRSQAVQAEAAGLEPSVDMNPLLLKPEAGGALQVVLHGRVVASGEAGDAAGRAALRERARRAVASSLERLRGAHELVVIEGAGSPAEPNLTERDLANMHVARLADAPVLLVGDAERGGVFAHLAGTLALLEAADRTRVRGFVINKLHGDAAALEPAPRRLEELTGVPVVGVVPWLDALAIADEDSAVLAERGTTRRASHDELEVAVVRLPHVANTDEFAPLEREPGVVVRYVTQARDVFGADLVVLPGTKSTRADLAWLRAAGFAQALGERARAGLPILGICGGCQMLGRSLEDPRGVEGAPGSMDGLGLLPQVTRFLATKRTRQVRAERLGSSWLTAGLAEGEAVAAYEIHMGAVEVDPGCAAAFRARARGSSDPGEAGDPGDAGAREGTQRGSVIGTMLHGLFEDARLRRGALAALRARRGSTRARDAEPRPSGATGATGDDPFDRLADALETHLDFEHVDALVRGSRGLPLEGARR